VVGALPGAGAVAVGPGDVDTGAVVPVVVDELDGGVVAVDDEDEGVGGVVVGDVVAEVVPDVVVVSSCAPDCRANPTSPRARKVLVATLRATARRIGGSYDSGTCRECRLTHRAKPRPANVSSDPWWSNVTRIHGDVRGMIEAGSADELLSRQCPAADPEQGHGHENQPGHPAPRL
jgi:hypothetical protein